MSNKFIIAQEGFKPLAITAGVWFVLKFILSFDLLGNLTLLLFVFMLYIFRNPEREIYGSVNEIISPIDGKVVAIDNKKGKNYIYVDVSLLDTHLLRMPDDGKVSIESQRNGLHLNPNTKKGKLLNRELTLSFENLKLHLLSGVCRFDIIINNIGDIPKGKRFGFFLQGVAKIEVNDNIKIPVKIGDKLLAGESVIAIKQ
ncbi:phosphatidylserine decarboxylase [Arcobacter sp. FWKO B]|uniref:phosphatidylserine decarboxylase n=1 Tax=Arcobacter sp. FWKO B TaxID=2593672 RepID=UPI0018A4138A|nr:phosphatidylserine decarboxylase [Arcobacter sp. FWKO B]QOG12811.1 hypothetical protein FWKOB_08940 [Arcobacter sp. FWKO B]